MIRIPDRSTTPDSRPGPRPIAREFSGPILVVGLALIFVFLSIWARGRVDADLQLEEAEWNLFLDRLPRWFPPTFRGELQELDRLPERISLRPPHWRRRLREGIERNPWISRVLELRREQGNIYFRAAFVRPVVAVQSVGGFLLVDARGRVVDFQEGTRLAPQWGIPEYLDHHGPWGRLESDQRLRGPQIDELLSILDLLWNAHVFDRWPDALREITAEERGDDDRLWSLFLPGGTELVWGRAPNAPHLSPLDEQSKLENLFQVMRYWRELEPARRIQLWSTTTPLVVDLR